MPVTKFQLVTLTNNCFVVNTKPHGSPGEHWVAIYKENNKKEYFDSYGFPPLVTEIKTFIGKNYRYNKATLQNFDTVVCGEYCIYFLYYRCRGYSMRDIVKFLFDEPSRNDEIVDDFVRQRFEIPITLAFNQRCTCRQNVYKGSVGDYPRSVDVEIGERH